MIPLNCIYLQNYPIFRQLQLEEALLRVDDRNWCIINEGSSKAIVMGISGKAEDLVDLNRWTEKPVPLIRRFSGGGTVFVDENTLFVSFIGNSLDMKVPCNPQAILDWTGRLYSTIFNGMDFRIRENDYAMGHKKFGGNAQYMRKNRWLHHSSLLWDFDPENMAYLRMPKKTPNYREGRPHEEFLCSLKKHFNHPQDIVKKIQTFLDFNFKINKSSPEIEEIFQKEHRKTTTLL